MDEIDLKMWLGVILVIVLVIVGITVFYFVAPEFDSNVSYNASRLVSDLCIGV